MAVPSRYSVGGDEGSIYKILPNKLGIKNQKELEDTETVLLSDAYRYFFDRLDNLNLNTEFLFEIHKYFLGPLYTWAGKSRTVEISKENVLFAASTYITRAMQNLDKIVKNNLPTGQDSKSQISLKLAIIHCEFNAIHPFREGNGRTIRLFLDLLVRKTGYSIIDFKKSTQEQYIRACIAGMKQDYTEMKKVIYRGLRKT